MPTPNYGYEKRQRELAKKRKNEEKRQRKATPRPDGQPADAAADGATNASGTPETPTDADNEPGAER